MAALVRATQPDTLHWHICRSFEKAEWRRRLADEVFEPRCETCLT